MPGESGGTPPPNRLLPRGADVFPPLSATIRAEFAARSVRAPQHLVNDDHFLIARLSRSEETLHTSLPADMIGKRFDEHAYAMVVADGMGEAGETASRLAIAALLELGLRFGEWRLRVAEGVAPDIIRRIGEFYRQIDGALVNVNQAGAGVALHTTLTAAVSAGRDLFFAHVGHSRAYLHRDGQLIQLTRDQTKDGRRNTQRSYPANLAGAASDVNHVLTDALGAGAVDPRVDIERVSLVDGDVVLLCTNGLTDAIADATIAGILGSTPAVEDQAAALVASAIESGAADDATVVVACYHVPD
jgi:protein phosphatase